MTIETEFKNLREALIAHVRSIKTDKPDMIRMAGVVTNEGVAYQMTWTSGDATLTVNPERIPLPLHMEIFTAMNAVAANRMTRNVCLTAEFQDGALRTIIEMDVYDESTFEGLSAQLLMQAAMQDRKKATLH
jgi:hypothetical protein